MEGAGGRDKIRVRGGRGGREERREKEEALGEDVVFVHQHVE